MDIVAYFSSNPVPLIILAFFGVWLIWSLVSRYFLGEAGLSFDKDDPDMLAAREAAQVQFDDFLRRMNNRLPADEHFLVKFNLTPDAADGEWIWATDVREEADGYSACLVNEPLDRRFQMDQRVSFTRQQIGDWSFMDDGVAFGHFMTRVMLKSASPRVRRRQEAALGWV
jgi:uncharacterized protein YegJ (DUF2314 family)